MAFRDGFERVKNIIPRRGFDDDDIHNFDEAGVSIELTTSSRVLRRRFWEGSAQHNLSGNRYMAKSIKCCRAAGRTTAYVVIRGSMEARLQEAFSPLTKFICPKDPRDLFRNFILGRKRLCPSSAM